MMSNEPPQGAHSADPVRAALIGIEVLYLREGESGNDCFERVAKLFHKDTGYLRPGKDYGALSGFDDEQGRLQAWHDWIAAKVAAVRTALAAPEGPAPEPVAWVDERAIAWLAQRLGKQSFITTVLEAKKSFERPMPLYATTAPEAPPPVEARQPHNPWRASIENILTGDNYFRAAEWHELLADLDRLYAMPPAVKPLDDPRLQQAFGDAIEGALAFGYQQNNKPPVGHWLNRFWNIGSAEAEKASKPPIVTDEMVTAYLKANDEYWRKVDEIAPPIGVWRNGTPREATRESLRAALA